jgi:hypothetical protein
MREKEVEVFEKLGELLNALEVVVNKPMEEDRGNIDACIHRFFLLWSFF